MLLGFLQATLSSVPKDDILIISCSHIHNRKAWVTWRCSAYINNGQCLWRAAVLVFFLSQMKNWDSESTLWKGRWNPNSSSLYMLPLSQDSSCSWPDESGLQSVCRLLDLICPITRLWDWQCQPQFTHKETEPQRSYMMLQGCKIANSGDKTKIWSFNRKYNQSSSVPHGGPS